MKKLVLPHTLICVFILIITCKRIDLNYITKLTTVSATSGVTSLSAKGTIIDLSDAIHSEYGFCYSENANPTVDDEKISLGVPHIGDFTRSISGLKMGTTYYVRAYCKDGEIYKYGEIKSVTTDSIVVTTLDVTAINAVNANSGGTITIAGSATITSRGVCWSTSANPTAKLITKTSDGTGAGNFTSVITGLTKLTTYNIRAYAIAGYDTIYATQKSFTTTNLTLPTVTTIAISAISASSATSGGNITFDGGATVIARGICWSTSANPTTTDSKTTDGIGVGSFTSSIVGLTAGTTYHIRAYATNSAGTAYGTDISFATNDVPTITTTTVTNITSSTATGGGNVITDGGTTITARGVCWSTSANPTTTDSKTIDGTGVGSFTSNIVGLTAGKTYHVRAYATNSAGTAYGTDIPFSSNPILPAVNTTAISNITSSSATGGGSITTDGGATVTARGICWSISANPTTTDSKTIDGTGVGSFNSSIVGLNASATYHVRAYATNSAGTAYGTDISFTTNDVPTITTTTITDITSSTATGGGSISSDGGTTITARGVCWSTSTNPTTANSITLNGTGIGVFASSITGLTANTTYYVKAYVTNNDGTIYGNQVSFTTLPSASYIVNDIDGNVYHTVTIGTQIWLIDNLKTTKYRDGTTISNITDNTEWTTQTTGAYCWYENNPTTYKDTYGALYNWYAVVDSRNLCPSGWHVPTNIEWNILAAYLGGINVAGDKLKAIGAWSTYFTIANNSSGFTALPGGDRIYSNGLYGGIGASGEWWSVTVNSATTAWSRGLNYSLSSIIIDESAKLSGFSVRCIKD